MKRMAVEKAPIMGVEMQQRFQRLAFLAGH
jgi:hypothetical protein